MTRASGETDEQGTSGESGGSGTTVIDPDPISEAGTIAGSTARGEPADLWGCAPHRYLAVIGVVPCAKAGRAVAVLAGAGRAW